MAHKIGEEHHKAKLTEKDVRYIRKNYQANVKGYGFFAKKFGVSISSVRDVLSYRSWKRVP